MDWFEKAEFGIFIHWGLYSVPAYDDPECAKNRKIGNGAEWYYSRFTKRPPRIARSDRMTKEFHQKNYGGKSYFEAFEPLFTGENFDADKWCALVRDAGARYMVITAKHHDGFCLWPTKTTPHNVMNTPLQKDVIGMLRASSAKHDLKFGIYYSWIEHNRCFTSPFIDAVVLPQLKELEAYRPDLFWMDGDWSISHKYPATVKLVSEFVERLHKQGIIINNRLGKDATVRGDYDNFQDRFIPKAPLTKRFESCYTIGLSWGRNKQQKKEHYKTGKELKDVFGKVNKSNGNLLLNLGPDHTGEFDPYEMSALHDFIYLQQEFDPYQMVVPHDHKFVFSPSVTDQFVESGNSFNVSLSNVES